MKRSSYDLRKVLVPKREGCASMTMARFVPWGLPVEPEGIHVLSLAAYLGVDRKTITRTARRLGLALTYEAPTRRERHRCAKGRRMVLSDEDAAKVMVRVRAQARTPQARASRRRSSPA